MKKRDAKALAKKQVVEKKIEAKVAALEPVKKSETASVVKAPVAPVKKAISKKSESRSPSKQRSISKSPVKTTPKQVKPTKTTKVAAKKTKVIIKKKASTKKPAKVVAKTKTSAKKPKV